MQSREPLLLLTLWDFSSDGLDKLVREMCVSLSPTANDNSIASLTAVTLFMRQPKTWSDHTGAIDAWLKAYPTGRVALIFTGRGTECGRLRVIGKDYERSEEEETLDPVEVCPGSLSCCRALTLVASGHMDTPWSIHVSGSPSQGMLCNHTSCIS